VTIDEVGFESISWISNPKTLGDLSFLQIMNIIKKRMNNCFLNLYNIQEEEDALNNSRNESILNEKVVLMEKKEKETLINYIKNNNFIERVFDLLQDPSDTKKDASILIICLISSNRFYCLELLMKKEIIIRLIKHIESFKTHKFVNYKEHIISSLDSLRNIYVKDIKFRKFFIENGGALLLYEFLTSQDPDIVHEILFNIEDLIYKDDEEINNNNYGTISKLIIYEIVDVFNQP